MSVAKKTEVGTAVALRDPDLVMRLSRLGSAHPMRLSFCNGAVLIKRGSSKKTAPSERAAEGGRSRL